MYSDYADSDFTPTGISKIIVYIMIGIIVICSIVIPFVVNEYYSADNYFEPGETWEYRPTTSVPAEIIVSGSVMDYGTYENGLIILTFEDEGTYTLNITAESTHPSQYAEQSYTFVIKDGIRTAQSVASLTFTIPIMMCVGLIIWIIRRFVRPMDDYNDF